jgi:hypothetical protein
MIQLKSFDLAFHFSFNQNKLWTNWRKLDHVSDAYVTCVSLFGHLFWKNGHFDSNVKLFPVIYANYRPMTDDRRQTETVHHIRYTTMFSPCSKHHSWFLHLIIIFWRGALCHNYTLFHHVSNNAIPYLMLKMSNNAIPYHMLKMHYTIKLNTNMFQ